MINNSKEQLEIRKAENTLIVVGMGVMIFSVWSAIKILGTMIVRKDGVLDFIQSTMAENQVISDYFVYVAFIIIFGIFLAFGVAAQLFVGLSAISEGRGRTAGRLYPVLTVLFILANTMSAVSAVRGLFSEQETEFVMQDVSLASVVIEVTSLIMLIEMLASSIKLRRYRRREREEAAGNAA